MRRSVLAALGLTVGACVSGGCGSSSGPCSGAACGGGAAASGSASTASAASAASSGSASATGTGGAGSGGATASGSGGTGGNALCVQTAHQGACTMCCASDNAAGYSTYVAALIQYCACTAGAACYPQCSDAMDLCSNQSAQTGSATCIDCVNGVAKTDPCFTATTNSVDATCAANPSCAAMTTCWQGCTGLPM